MEKIKIGIFGINRGASYINSLLANDAEIVAICDKDEFWLNKAKEIMGDKTTYYTSFDEFYEIYKERYKIIKKQELTLLHYF